MKIQAVNPMMSANNSQPIKQVEFAKKKSSDVNAWLGSVIKEEGDSFTSSDPYTMEQKYNLACQLAAYYKIQYDNIVKKNGCLA